MEKYFVTYNQALALKEIGYVDYSWFGSECSLYKHNGKHTFYMNGIGDNTYISAPLKSQVFEWFRDKHNLYHEIRTFAWDYDKKELGFSIRTYLNPIDIETERLIHSEVYETYKEAESACIDKLIEIVKGQ